jgi:hypothetical protein
LGGGGPISLLLIGKPTTHPARVPATVAKPANLIKRIAKLSLGSIGAYFRQSLYCQ